jgi:hypothetical protein
MRNGSKRWEARTPAGQFSLNHVWHAPQNLPAIFAKPENASPMISSDLWLQLKPGSLVLAAGFDEQDNLDSWWEAIIVRIDDGEFLVRWRDDPNEPRVSCSHEYIALLHPKITTS